MTRCPPRTRTAFLLLLFSAVLATGWSGAAGPAQASPAVAGTRNPYAPTYRHPYRHGAVPTRDAARKMKVWDAAHPRPVPAGVPADLANNLRYGGGIDGIGVTTGQERVYLVF